MECPLINKYSLILARLIKRMHKTGSIPLIQKCQWPKNKKFAVCLSHDVDVVKFTLSDAASINKIIDFVRGKNPYWQFDKLIELEKKYNFKSSFFFCAGKRHNLDPNYSIRERRIINVIRLLKKRGNEVGMHASYLAYDNKEMMKSEKMELSKLVGNKIGTRTHFLRFKVPGTFVLEDKLDFYYDSSLGYSTNTGYRSGFCWAYNPYAIGSEKELRIFELPLSIMDGALFCEHKTANGAFRSLKGIFHNIEEFNGVIVIDWHQRVFNEKYFRGWSAVYQRCLEYFKKKDAFVGTASGIIDWTKNRNSTSIFRTDGKILKFRLNSKTGVKDFALRILFAGNMKLKVYNSNNCQISKNKNDFIITFKQINKNQNITLGLVRS